MAESWKDIIRSETVKNGVTLIVPWKACRQAAQKAGIPPRQAEIWACENGICPSRYERNIGTLGLEGQARLLSSRVAVIGCGGLGGWIVEILARAGVGELVLVDGDTFSDNNLNRQLFCDESSIGRSKAATAAERAGKVNGAVETTARDEFLSPDNAEGILEGCAAAIDALDGNNARSTLFSACRMLGIPMVHGAIGGFWGQSCVLFPEDTPPWELAKEPDRGMEQLTGNPPFTPPFIASIQAAEVIRLITRVGKPLRELLWCDLKEQEHFKIRIQK
jgi:molybdopterin/thiamine biosynthesis adenylyltransferase